MIINPDHMSQKAVDTTITLAEGRHYSGVISPTGGWTRATGRESGSSAGWPSPTRARPRIRAGLEAVRADGTTPNYSAGARAPTSAGSPAGRARAARRHRVTYPFKSYDGKVTFDRQRTGDRVFDYAKEGVAHYGLYADWVEEVRKLGGDADRCTTCGTRPRPTWTCGSAPTACPAPPAARRPRSAQPGCPDQARRVGRRAADVAAGQPQQRARAWSWCVDGAGNAAAADVAVLSPQGRVGLVGTSASGAKAAGVARPARGRGGSPARASVAGGLEAKRSRGATYVFAVNRGRVRDVAVAAGVMARSKKAVRETWGCCARPRPTSSRCRPQHPPPAREDREPDADRRCGWSCAGRGGVPVLP